MKTYKGDISGKTHSVDVTSCSTVIQSIEDDGKLLEERHAVFGALNVKRTYQLMNGICVAFIASTTKTLTSKSLFLRFYIPLSLLCSVQ